MLQAFLANPDYGSRGNGNSGIRRAKSNCQPLFYKPQLEALEDRNLLNAGSLDPTFGVGGLVIPAFDMARDAYQEALQSDGKIVVAGSFTADPPAPAWLFTVARYNPDGTPTPVSAGVDFHTYRISLAKLSAWPFKKTAKSS